MNKILNIGHLSTAYHTNFILMENDDLRNDIQMDINWILFGTGPAMVKAFKEEKIEAGYMGLPPAMIGINDGVPIKCVAGGHVEGTIMVAPENYKNKSELGNNLGETLAQFKGKVIGVPSRGSIHDVILNHYLTEFDLIDKIEIKNYKQAEFIALDMKKGILDAGVGTPALAVFASTILKSHLIVPAVDLWANNPSYGIFFHEKYIKDSPDIILKFLKHHKNASSLLRSSQSLAAEKISKTFEIVDKTYAQAVLKISPKYCIALSTDYVKESMNFMKILYDLGYIEKKLKKSSIFNFDFINNVHPEKHHYIIY